MKTCNKCGREQPDTEFWPTKAVKSGRRGRCKTCDRATNAAWYQRNQAYVLAKQAENPNRPEQVRKNSAAYWERVKNDPDKRVATRARHKLSQRDWYAKNRDAIIKRNRDNYDPERARIYTLKRYGMTIEQFNEMMARQGGRCACCTVLLLGTERKVVVDHCHSTGRVRGILCSQCNTGIGMFNEQRHLFASASSYLERQMVQP